MGPEEIICKPEWNLQTAGRIGGNQEDIEMFCIDSGDEAAP